MHFERRKSSEETEQSNNKKNNCSQFPRLIIDKRLICSSQKEPQPKESEAKPLIFSAFLPK